MSSQLPGSNTSNAVGQHQILLNEAQMQRNTIDTVANLKTLTRCKNTMKAYAKRRQRYW